MRDKSAIDAPKTPFLLEIKLRDKKPYTIGDSITGVVLIQPSSNTSFHNLAIDFIGTAQTSLHHFARSAAGKRNFRTTHAFLHIAQPHGPEHNESLSWLEMHKKYEFPFAFVVPENLLPSSCRHAVESSEVREAHCRLPPTLDATASADGRTMIKNSIDQFGSIRYHISATIYGLRSEDGAMLKSSTISTRHLLQIIPHARQDPPPYNIDTARQYVQSSITSVVRSFKLKQGCLTMRVPQPIALRIEGMTMVDVRLRFDPLRIGCTLPRLAKIQNKLNIQTIFSCIPCRSFMNAANSAHDVSRASHMSEMMLSPYTVSNVQWTEQLPQGSTSEENSAASHDHISPSARYRGGNFFVARLSLPVSLPTKHGLIPSFHTCFISRTYDLDIKLSLATSDGGLKLKVKVPVKSLETFVFDGSNRGANGEDRQCTEDDIDSNARLTHSATPYNELPVYLEQTHTSVVRQAD